jgi:hypothetical protein
VTFVVVASSLGGTAGAGEDGLSPVERLDLRVGSDWDACRPFGFSEGRSGSPGHRPRWCRTRVCRTRRIDRQQTGQRRRSLTYQSPAALHAATTVQSSLELATHPCVPSPAVTILSADSCGQARIERSISSGHAKGCEWLLGPSAEALSGANGGP